MKNHLLIALTLCLTALLFGQSLQVSAQQKYFSKTATIVFDAEGKLDDVEDIKATTHTATCVFDAETGNFEWSVPIKSFTFANSLMQQHFNENYMESEKYPKATFKGKVADPSAIDFSTEGSVSKVRVSGDLTIHGVTQKVDVDGQFKVKNGVPAALSSFEVALKDYNITIPKVVFMKIAENVKIDIYAPLAVLKK